MSRRLELVRWLGAAMLAAAVLQPVVAQTPAGAPPVTTTLTVRGTVARPVTLTVPDLAKLPVQHVDDTRIVRTGAARTETAQRLTGTLLRDVLNSAGIGDQRDLRRTIVVAIASDGYRAVFSWGELFNSPIGDGVVVIYARNGAPLGDQDGRIALVSLKDERPGPRHVKWL